ncbi:MAG: MgtC/SapB family protein [Proteobacteria bacterium]|nr:MgtC/SapB family protein [Pseudomonadota bacterium]
MSAAAVDFDFANFDLNMAMKLLVALAIGLLIGLEREWRKQDAEDHDRIGIRTFGLMGLLGGLGGTLTMAVGTWLVPSILVALAILLVNDRRTNGSGATFALVEDMTTLVAALVTVLLGVLAAIGAVELAVSGAVIVVALLYLKPTLHTLVGKLTQNELKATLRFLVISLVILPVLPDKGYGPYAIFNPRTVWLLVVMISAMSFVGYFAIRWLGAAIGVLATGLFGGLVSSTATTISFAKLASDAPGQGQVFAAGVVLANVVMAARILILAAVLAPAFAMELLVPIGLSAVTAALFVAFIWHRTQKTQVSAESIGITNPFELSQAIKFALLLTVVLLLERFLSERFGEAGLYVLAAIAGLADVDAITLSVAKHANAAGDFTGGIVAILLAMSANGLVKVVIAVRAGGIFARWSATAMIGMILAAAVGAIAQAYF